MLQFLIDRLTPVFDVERQILVAANCTLFYPPTLKQRQNRISKSRFRRRFIHSLVSYLRQCLIVCRRHNNLSIDTMFRLLGPYR